MVMDKGKIYTQIMWNHLVIFVIFIVIVSKELASGVGDDEGVKYTEVSKKESKIIYDIMGG